MLFQEAGKGRSRRNALPQSVLVLQTLCSSFSLSFIRVQSTTALWDSPAAVHHKMHRWNNYLLIRPSNIENYPQHLSKHFRASCTPLLFVQQLHNVPSVSYHQLESHKSWKAQGGKAEFLGSCRDEGEWQQKYPSTWDTHTQICETSVYCMPQVTSLKNVFLF